MKKTLLLCVAIALSITGQSFAQSTKTTSTKPASKTVSIADQTQNNIAEYILSVQPRKGKTYAQHLAKTICAASEKYGVSPYIVAATAKVESDFVMHLRPCIGIMQVSKNEARNAKKIGLNAYDLEDNIYVGAWCLSKYNKEMLSKRYKKATKERVRSLTSRSSVHLDRTTNLRRMLGRYNGCGPNGKYVDRVIRISHKIGLKPKRG